MVDRISKIDILKKLTRYCPRVISNWPTDIFSMCEFANSIGLSPGIVHADVLINEHKILFSGLLSKGKPPERRESVILLTARSYVPLYVSMIKSKKENNMFFDLLTTSGPMFCTSNSIIEYIEEIDISTDMIPSISYIKTHI